MQHQRVELVTTVVGLRETIALLNLREGGREERRKEGREEEKEGGRKGRREERRNGKSKGGSGRERKLLYLILDFLVAEAGVGDGAAGHQLIKEDSKTPGRVEREEEGREEERKGGRKRGR